MQMRMKTQLIGTALAFTLGLGTVVPSAWASDGVAVPIIPAVSVAKLGTFELKNIQMLNQQGSLNVTYTITVRNESSATLQLIDYMTRIKTKSGLTFAAKLMPQDKTKKSVYPGASQDLTYTAQLDELTQLSDLTVEIVKWDFSLPNYQRSLGTISIPDTYSQALPMNGNRVVTIGGTQLNMTLTDFQSGKGETQYIPSIRMKLENIGSEATKTPDYQFVIRTSQGRLYPLTLKSQAVNMRPKEDTQWLLGGTIPIDEDPANWQFVVTEQVQGITQAVPVVVYDLSETATTPSAQKDRQTFNAKDGTYTAKLNGIYRAPYESEDLLTADVKIYNPGKDVVTVPQLSGYFLMNNGVKIEAALVQMSLSAGINPADGVSFQAAGKIPSDTKFSSIKLVLQEKGTDNAAATDVLEFPAKGNVQTMPYYNQNDYYTVLESGRKFRYKMVDVNEYAGVNSDIFAVQVEVENLDSRSKTVPELVAHIGTNDGNIFEAQISVSPIKIAPSGKTMLEVWSELPSGYDSSNLHLIIGDAVSQGKLAASGATVDAYVKPVAFWLPNANDTVKKDNFSNMELYPYTISFYNMDTLNEEKNKQYTLKFDTSIANTKFAEANTANHNLVISLTDTSTGLPYYEKSYKVSNFITGSDGLKIGKGHLEINIPDADADFSNADYWYKSTELSIYDEFQGQRKLLATQNVVLYSTKTTP